MKGKINVREMMIFAMLGALLSASKWVMSFLPNIEPVTLLLLVYAYKFKWKALIPAYIFIALEMLLYGFNVYMLCYLYIWILPVIFGVLWCKGRWTSAVIAGVFGLSFGTLSGIPFGLMHGWEYLLSWIAGGLSYDALHGAANFILALLLYVPLTKLMEKL